MTNEIRYLNLGSLTPDIYSSVWEYGNLIDINCPTVIKFSSKKHIVAFFGGSKLDISSFFNGEIEYPIVRAYEDPDNIDDDKLAYWIEGPNVFNFIYIL